MTAKQFRIPSPEFVANRYVRQRGTSNRATEITLVTGPARPLESELGKVSQRCLPRLVEYDRYHAESRTGIRASMTALKRFWSTYHYVPTVCHVAVASIDAVYSNDNH